MDIRASSRLNRLFYGHDCVYDKPDKLPKKVYLKIIPFVPQCYSLTANPSCSTAVLLKKMDDDIIVKQEEHIPWLSPLPVTDVIWLAID